jgi:hypothetical protein
MTNIQNGFALTKSNHLCPHDPNESVEDARGDANASATAEDENNNN